MATFPSNGAKGVQQHYFFDFQTLYCEQHKSDVLEAAAERPGRRDLKRIFYRITVKDTESLR
jgi:hypothetical protein